MIYAGEIAYALRQAAHEEECIFSNIKIFIKKNERNKSSSNSKCNNRSNSNSQQQVQAQQQIQQQQGEEPGIKEESMTPVSSQDTTISDIKPLVPEPIQSSGTFTDKKKMKPEVMDFDLCVSCKEKDGHPHQMEKLDFDLDDGSSSVDAKQTNPQEIRKLSIQRCIQSLVHACQCRDDNCHNYCLPNCQTMKQLVMHTKNCKRKTNGGCPICKKFIELCCYHAKHCQETKCLVLFCSNIKHLIKQ